MMYRALFGLMIALALAVQARVWTDVQGRQVQGEMIAADTQSVTLRLANGRQLKVALGSLCVADQRFVRQNLARKNPGQTDDVDRAGTGAIPGGKNVVRLPIVDRKPSSDAPKGGWSGEACIQMVLMYHGVYASQKQINAATGNAQQGKGLVYTEMYGAMRRFGLATVDYKKGHTSAPEFYQWARKHLDQGRPIIAGVKIYPDKNKAGKVDQFVVIVGYDKKGLFLNTNVYDQGTIYRTVKELGSTKKGISLMNYARTVWAHAIKDPSSWKKTGRQPVHLAIHGEQGNTLRATLTCLDLTPGKRYILFRRRTAREHSAVAVKAFEASGKEFTYSDTIKRNSFWHYDCVQSNDGKVKGIRFGR